MGCGEFFTAWFRTAFWQQVLISTLYLPVVCVSFAFTIVCFVVTVVFIPFVIGVIWFVPATIAYLQLVSKIDFFFFKSQTPDEEYPVEFHSQQPQRLHEKCAPILTWQFWAALLYRLGGIQLALSIITTVFMIVFSVIPLAFYLVIPINMFFPNLLPADMCVVSWGEGCSSGITPSSPWFSWVLFAVATLLIFVLTPLAQVPLKIMVVMNRVCRLPPRQPPGGVASATYVSISEDQPSAPRKRY